MNGWMDDSKKGLKSTERQGLHEKLFFMRKDIHIIDRCMDTHTILKRVFLLVVVSLLNNNTHKK